MYDHGDPDDWLCKITIKKEKKLNRIKTQNDGKDK